MIYPIPNRHAVRPKRILSLMREEARDNSPELFLSASSLRIKIGSEGEKSVRVGDDHIAALRCYSFLQRMAGRAGWVLAAAALVAFANDLISFAQTGTYRVMPAGQVWFDIHVASST